MRVPSRLTLLEPLGVVNGPTTGRNGTSHGGRVSVGGISMPANIVPTTEQGPRRFTKHVPKSKSGKRRGARSRSKSSRSTHTLSASASMSALAAIASVPPLPAEGSTLSSSTFVVDKREDDKPTLGSDGSSSFDSGHGREEGDGDVPLADLGLDLENEAAGDGHGEHRMSRL